MATKAQQEAFLKKIVPIAQEQAKLHGYKLFASVCIAQACHESGWGTSAKMVNANAVFGIKVGKSAYKFGTAWKGAAYYSGTTEYYDGVNPSRIMDFFRKYDSVKDSTEDYFDMLCHCKRYNPALNCATPEQSIRAIVAGGYATGPEYAERIVELMRSGNFRKYDIQQNTMPKTDNPYADPVATIRHGMRGDGVRWLQTELNRHGYTLRVDGIAGDITIGAVLDFQKRHGLVVDGLCGPATRAALLS